VPTEIDSLNKGLSTLQFQSLSVNPTDAKDLMGGTQDNGTWEPNGHSGVNWNMIIWGDGGQSGFNAANPDVRFNTFTGQANDANFRGGDPSKWVVITGDIVNSPEGSYFYAPVTADPNPANAGSIYQGSFSVWRTQDWGGDPAFLEANCSEFTTPSTTRRAVTSRRSGPRVTPSSPRTTRSTAAPTARCGGRRDRAGLGHEHDLGRDRHRPRLRLEERRCSGRLGHVDADRHARDERPEPVRLVDLRRPGGREPRVDLVLRVQREHAHDSGPRVRGAVQPGRRDGDVDEPRRRHGPDGRPADDGPRPRRRHGRSLRVD
jgi:hypothetical protein